MICAEWNEEDWSTLITAIELNTCILMLGPDASFEEVDGQFQPLTEIFSKKLAEGKEIKEAVEAWGIDRSNLAQVSLCYLFLPRLGRNSLLDKYRRFFKERRELTSEFYRNLAALPFYFAVISTPDFMFSQALRERDKNHIIASYNFNGREIDLVEMGNRDRPLLFYLYGNVNEPQSLVLTEDDLLNFLTKIVSKNPALPKNIVSELQEKNKTFLFLGFGFKHWYLRILLHVLQVRSKESRSFALEQFAPQQLEEFKNTIFFFGESDYRIQICNADLKGFARELKERYERSLITSPSEIPKAVPRDAPTLFICHASENKNIAAQLYQSMAKSGFRPWLDKENIRGGERWNAQIQKTIEEIDYFLVLNSKALAEKEEGYVNKEIHRALERQENFRRSAFIIPLLIDDAPLLEEFKDMQAIDLRDPSNIEKLSTHIKRDQQIRKR
jgi:hypothetical protein